MKSSNSVRSPQLMGSGASNSKYADASIGDKLRKAKKDLFFSRCIYGILITLFVTAVVAAFVLGYAEPLVDWFNSLL